MKERGGYIILTEDLLCVKDWLCETGNENYYTAIGDLVKSKLIRYGIKSTYVGDKAGIDFISHVFHKKPENYNDLWLENFNKCIDEEDVDIIKHTPTRNAKIGNCLRKSFIKTERDIRGKEKYIKQPDGKLTFRIPPRNSLPSSIAEWSDKNNVTIVTSDVNPMYEPKKAIKKVITPIEYTETCTKKNFHICSYDIADAIRKKVVPSLQ